MTFFTRILGLLSLLSFAVSVPAFADQVTGSRVAAGIKITWKTENRMAMKYFTSSTYEEDMEAVDQWVRPFIRVPLYKYVSAIDYVDVPRPNGSANLVTHRIVVEGLSQERFYNLYELRSTLLHEIGHLIFTRYLVAFSPTYKMLFNKIEACGSDSRSLPCGQGQASLYALFSYHELIADTFAVSILGEPVLADRDFAMLGRLWSNKVPIDDLVSDVHHQCDSVRGFFWTNYLERGFDAPRTAVQFLDNLMAASVKLWEPTAREIWAAVARGETLYGDSPIVQPKNARLVSMMSRVYPTSR